MTESHTKMVELITIDNVGKYAKRSKTKETKVRSSHSERS